METSTNESNLGDWCAQWSCSPSGSAFCPVTFQSLESLHAEQARLGREGEALLTWAPAGPHLVPSAALSLCTTRPTRPVESEARCGHHEQGRWNDTETEKLTHSSASTLCSWGKKRKVFKHKRISHSNDSEKKNASQIASSFGHQIALLTAVFIKKSKEER